MALTEKRKMTQKNLAAHRSNGPQSRGPATPEGKARAALMTPQDENALLMRRMQDSNFRQGWRVTNLLLKIKRQAREEEALEKPSRSLNVNENTAI